MKFLGKHWYDLGGVLALLVLVYLWMNKYFMSSYQNLMWISLISLFIHQLEEYRIVGTFPGMLNSTLFNSDIPDRYPLNTRTSFYVNVFTGWLFYFLAALFAEKAVWLGIATLLVSAGNIIAHTLVFNIKGKTLYNAGLASSWILFAPCLYFSIKILIQHSLGSVFDFILGIVLGLALNYIGILKLIDWMKDRNSPYIFEQRNLLPRDRN